MKKKKLSVEVINKIALAKKQVINTLSGDASELRDALIALFDELANQEEEFDINQFKSEIETIIAKYSDVPEATANAIAKATENAIKRVQNSLPANERLTPAVKNQVAAAILKAHDKADARKAALEVLTRNGISGIEFEASVDYVINWKVEDLNPLFAKLHKTMISKFFYGEIDLKNAEQIAHGWKKTNNYEKLVEELSVEAKKIETDYVYKRQQLAFADLDEIEEAGQLTQFLQMISKELDVMIINAIVIAILIGDNVNASADRVRTFETIGTKTTSDLFTTVVEASDADLAAYMTALGVSASTPAVSRYMAALKFTRDHIHNPNGKEVVAVMSRGVLSLLSPRVVAAGGDFVFRSKEEVAAELGVDDIYLTDVMPATLAAEEAGKAAVIFLIPDGYWYKEKKTIDVAYPKYENNVQNIQKERNIGGKIHDLLSTAVYRVNGSKGSGSASK